MVKRFSKNDWLNLGLKALADEGPSAIRIDHLCRVAQRTKGSFYHHFKTREAFVDALLSYWEQELTERVITQANTIDDPVKRLIGLNALTEDISSGQDGGIERQLRRWAGSDAKVEAAINAIDKRRIDYVASLLMQAKDISSQQAIDLAVMNYASLIGFQQMFTPIHPDRRRRIDWIYVDILNTLPDHK
jgi:AcrR family transcriptional regulator